MISKGCFSKEHIQMSKQYRKKYWVSQIIRRIYIKTTLRYYFIHIRINETKMQRPGQPATPAFNRNTGSTPSCPMTVKQAWGSSRTGPNTWAPTTYMGDPREIQAVASAWPSPSYCSHLKPGWVDRRLSLDRQTGRNSRCRQGWGTIGILMFCSR